MPTMPYEHPEFHLMFGPLTYAVARQSAEGLQRGALYAIYPTPDPDDNQWLILDHLNGGQQILGQSTARDLLHPITQESADILRRLQRSVDNDARNLAADFLDRLTHRPAEPIPDVPPAFVEASRRRQTGH